MREIDTIAIHCTDSEFADLETIIEWHKARGFRTIGYHAVILNGHPKSSRVYVPELDGKVFYGRSPLDAGAHVEGFNRTSMAVCLVSADRQFTVPQMLSLVRVVRDWQVAYNVPHSRVLGHNEFPGVTKACPHFNVKALREFLAFMDTAGSPFS